MNHKEIQSAIEALKLPASFHTGNRIKNAKNFRADYFDCGRPHTIIAKVRWDDKCGNGYNSFSVTADIYGPDRLPGSSTVKHENGKTLWHSVGGCCHNEISKRFPEFAHLIRWHLFDHSGPMHYIANTVYYASEREIYAHEKPAHVTLEWEPQGITGEGKPRDLAAARSCAAWPDASDEDLTAPGLEARLIARLPALVAEMKRDLEALGFTY